MTKLYAIYVVQYIQREKEIVSVLWNCKIESQEVTKQKICSSVKLCQNIQNISDIVSSSVVFACVHDILHTFKLTNNIPCILVCILLGSTICYPRFILRSGDGIPTCTYTNLLLGLCLDFHSRVEFLSLQEEEY